MICLVEFIFCGGEDCGRGWQLAEKVTGTYAAIHINEWVAVSLSMVHGPCLLPDVNVTDIRKLQWDTFFLTVQSCIFSLIKYYTPTGASISSETVWGGSRGELWLNLIFKMFPLGEKEFEGDMCTKRQVLLWYIICLSWSCWTWSSDWFFLAMSYWTQCPQVN